MESLRLGLGAGDDTDCEGGNAVLVFGAGDGERQEDRAVELATADASAVAWPLCVERLPEAAAACASARTRTQKTLS